LFTRNFIKVSEKTKTPQEFLCFEEELLKREDVRKSLATVRRKALNPRNKPGAEKPATLWHLLSAVIMECGFYAHWDKLGESEVYRSQDEPKKLAREIRKIRNTAIRLLQIDSQSEESYLFHYANKSHEKDPFLGNSYPDVLTDKQVMKALDILSGYFDRLNEYLENDRTRRWPHSGVAFRLPKSKGKRKDVLEYSLIHSLRRIFMDNIGEPLSPVTAVFRNATFQKKTPIDARRVREMLKEIDSDPNCIPEPTVGFLA